MGAYEQSGAFRSWNILDSFFREMPTGTLLRVARTESAPGRTTTTFGEYEKDRGKLGCFELVSGTPMFFDAGGRFIGSVVGGQDPSQALYADEILMANDLENLDFTIVRLGSVPE